MRLIVSGFSLLLFTLASPIISLAEEKSDVSSVCPSDLPTAITEIINRPEFERSRWGIEIQTLEEGKSLFSLNGNMFFTPASSLKLLTSAASLIELGTDYRIETTIYSTGTKPNLTSLRLEGQGDPTISTETLKNIVHQLQSRGIKRIENLIIDNSYFAPPSINPTWEWLDVHSYFATAVNSTILNQNTVTLTLLPQQIGQPVKYYWSDTIAARQWQLDNQAVTGNKDIDYNIELDSYLGKPKLQLRGELAVNEPPDVWDLAVVDPAQYFLESFRSQLTDVGITVGRGTVINQPEQNQGETELMTIYSPPMQQILEEVNQESNNLYAEVLGKILAKKLGLETATEAVKSSLNTIGINPNEYVLADVSGLSRQNLISPQILVKTLQIMSQLSQRESYQQSLSLASINGTLKNRFRNSSITGNLWGKTGTLTGVGTLSGYIIDRQNPSIVFSILVNNSELKSNEIRQAIDEIIVILNQLNKC
ncbi:MAG: D-alanyl-D-alanine carboxypeptidase/D-alanyl-D-alanine-endopeptidase [Cyanobacteria bacterium P01_G01_bin.67]